MMLTIRVETEQLLNAVLQLPEEELKQFVFNLFAAKAREKAPTLSEYESQLLMKINQGVPPSSQKRLNVLIKKRQAESITAKELWELKKLTDRSEKLNVERLEYLTELAMLRNVPLDELIEQLYVNHTKMSGNDPPLD